MTSLNQFSWKRAWDMYSCSECGRCQSLCPAYLTQKPLSPKRVIMQERELLKAETSRLARAGLRRLIGDRENSSDIPAEARSDVLIGGSVEEEAIWSCTTCLQCVENCPLLIEHVAHLIDQ